MKVKTDLIQKMYASNSVQNLLSSRPQIKLSQ